MWQFERCPRTATATAYWSPLTAYNGDKAALPITDYLRSGLDCRCRERDVLSNGLGEQGLEHQDACAAHEHSIGQIENGPVNQLKVNEFAYLAPDDTVVAVADRARHDQTESYREHAILGRAAPEQPIQNSSAC